MTDITFVDDISPVFQSRVSELLAGWKLPELNGTVRVSYLAGGANNVNFRLDTADQTFALKLRDAEDVAASNAAVLDAIEGQRLAFDLGVAPKVYAASAIGDFLSEFVTGITLRPQVIRDHHLIPAMVEALHKLHAGPPPTRRFRLDDDIRTFLEGARAVGAEAPAGFDAMRDAAYELNANIEAAGVPNGFIHADLVPQNFIATDRGILLVDFDYCGAGLTVLDIAGATSQAEMTDDETETFMALYDPDLDDAQRARVRGIQFVNAVREVAWAMMAEGTLGDRTNIFGDWSYKMHRDTNLDLAHQMFNEFDLHDLTREVGFVRDGALF